VDRNFWVRLVPQMALIDDSTWYALVALGALVEHPVSTAFATNCEVDASLTLGYRRQALEWYGKGINASRKTGTSAINLMNTLLFAACELLQDRPLNGLQLIRQVFVLNEALWKGGSKSTEIQSVLLPVMIRALLPLATFGCPITTEQRALVTDFLRQLSTGSIIYSKVVALMTELYDLIYESQILCNSLAHDPKTKMNTVPSAPSPETLAEQSALLEGLLAWETQLRESKILDEIVGEERQFLAQLVAIYCTTYIKLSCILDTSLTKVDNYVTYFATLIDEAALTLSHRAAGDRTFAFDVSVAPCLFYAGWACREPRLRRRAVMLLEERAPRQEILWSATDCVNVLKRVVAYEEGSQTFEPRASDETPFPLPERRLPMSRVTDPQSLPAEFPDVQEKGVDGAPIGFWRVRNVAVDRGDDAGVPLSFSPALAENLRAGALSGDRRSLDMFMDGMLWLTNADDTRAQESLRPPAQDFDARKQFHLNPVHVDNFVPESGLGTALQPAMACI
jgi:hypothetical protein